MRFVSVIPVAPLTRVMKLEPSVFSAVLAFPVKPRFAALIAVVPLNVNPSPLTSRTVPPSLQAILLPKDTVLTALLVTVYVTLL